MFQQFVLVKPKWASSITNGADKKKICIQIANDDSSTFRRARGQFNRKFKQKKYSL
ncbi:MAG: hypothetical protein CM15mP31_4290 [Gammaproteobacteria bacterium]|nr:MAG: hypothetical protein CM15mP31_4290 [Gammaproteobacteria bacterium]